jgi:hypothetical protein
MRKSEKAIENHKNFFPCSAAVLCAFADDIGMTEKQASAAAKPMAGGRMGKCGAVLAAETVLAAKFGTTDPRIAQFDAKFTEMNQSLMCRELKGGLTGKVLRSCRGCVTDAAELLETILAEAEA